MEARKNGLRILLVIDSLGSGGAQRQIVWLAIGLSLRGHDVAVFNYNPQLDHFRPELERRGIPIIDTKKTHRFDLGPVLTLRRHLKEKSYDLAVAFLDTPNVYTVLAAIGLKRTKVIVSERFTFSGNGIGSRTFLIYQCYRLAHAITVNASHQREQILKRFPWCRDKLFLIRNGVDLQKYHKRTKPRSDESGTMRALGVGTIVPRKNVFGLIEALRVARESGADIVIDWFGKVSPDSESQNEYSRCDELLGKYQLRSAWNWCGENDEMHEVYSKYDVLIHPAYSEGLPNAICEGLACGIPILASAVGDHPRLVSSESNGWLFDPENVHDMAKTIELALRQKHRWPEMADASRRTAEEKLSIDRMIDDYEERMLLLCAAQR